MAPSFLISDMYLKEILNDKGIKPKEKTETIAQWLSGGELTLADLLAFAATAKDPAKGTCLEAIELVAQSRPEALSKEGWDFVCAQLSSKAPRVRWESAKVIARTAHLFPEHLEQAVSGLLANTSHTGTVVRWSAATALCQIALLGTAHNAEWLPALQQIATIEEKDSIKKIYAQAFKKLKVM